jgi:metal-responsive CopG/Arc/MetJ family transcriptional regulator
VRVKISITLPEDLLQTIDRTDPNRSAFIERASRAYLARIEKTKREAQDIQLINANADRLNAEAMDVIGYQFPNDRR